MTFCKRLLGLLTCLLGLIGVIGCGAVLYLAGTSKAPLQNLTTQVFNELDQFLVLVDGRLVQTQQRVNTAKITTKTIEQSLRGWTERESTKLLAHRVEVAEKTQYLASALEQAEEWIVFTESVVELAKRGVLLGEGRLEIAKSIDRLVADLAVLRDQIDEAQQLVASVRERIHELDDEQSVGERVEQAAQLVIRVVATLGLVDARLAEIRTNVSETQRQMRRFQFTLMQWTIWGVLVVGFIAIWMAAGQIALSICGWRALRYKPAMTDSPKN